ncbi:MAG: helix-turn-helix transcriptional regulator [Acidimicrobiales bacterium]
MERRHLRMQALGTLAEPLRRRTYEYVAARSEPVNRDTAAAALEVPRSVAAFHLDKLVDASLLDVEYRRPPGRGGPGAGRPAKWYRLAAREVALSVPERHYEVAASLLAQSLAEARGSDPTRKALARIARRYGRTAASAFGIPAKSSPRQRLKQVSGLLEEQGYEPRAVGGELTLENCPFRAVAELTPELVCSMNLDLVQGVLEEVGDPCLSARLDPAPGRCCVTVSARR